MKRNSKQSRFRYGLMEERRLLAADFGMEMELEFAANADRSELSSAIDRADAVTENANLSEEIQNDSVLQWNSLFGDILVADVENQNPGYASRAMAILNLSIYDAVALSAGEPETAFYDYSDLDIPRTRLDVDVVVANAAHTVLSSLYPSQQDSIDSALVESISASSRNRGFDASVALGRDIGNAIIEARANDGYDVTIDYNYADEIGQFQADPLNPDVPVWGPAWGRVDTFAISSADSFLPSATPDLDSEQYAVSYNEVLELGAVDSSTRTADQTEAGIFWAYDREGLGTPIALFSDVLETIAIQEGNSMEQNAALFAQASVSMADAGIVAWRTKFSENFWRPVTAIQQGDSDGNDLTNGDEDWTALGAPDGGDDVVGFTPQFPTYISGHATFGGALFGALQEFYGADDVSFELQSAELEVLMNNQELQEAYGLDLDDATRSYNSFSEAMAENGRSRVYLGIHFDFDDTVGQEVGQSVATEVSSQFAVVDSEGGDTRDGRDDRRNRDRRRGPDRGRNSGQSRLVGLADSGDMQSPQNQVDTMRDGAFADFNSVDFESERENRRLR